MPSGDLTPRPRTKMRLINGRLTPVPEDPLQVKSDSQIHNKSVPPFDISVEAEALNSGIDELEQRLARVPFRVDTMVRVIKPAGEPDIALRYRRDEGRWGLEWGELPTRGLAAIADVASAFTGEPTAREFRWRPLREVALVKKVEAIGLLPDLIKAMKTEFDRRLVLCQNAGKTLDQVLKALDGEGGAAR